MATKTRKSSTPTAVPKVEKSNTHKSEAYGTPGASGKLSAATKAKAGKAKGQAIVTGLGNAPSALDELLGPPSEIEVSAGAQFIEVRDIPLDQIVIAPGNPRKRFDPILLDELGEWMLKDGQLQPGVVRLLANGEGYELFIGERRFRACQLKGIATYRASVFEATTAAMIEMRGIENEVRADFNPIEKAIWWKQMLDEAGYTQTSLALKLGVSQGEVSNTVRLLKLPEAWQERIISGEIPQSEARCLVPWVEMAPVMESLEQAYKATIKNGKIQDFEWFVAKSLRGCSRPLKENYYWDGKLGQSYDIDLKLNDAELKLLDVHKVNDRHGNGSELRAFNVPEWEKQLEKFNVKRLAAEAKRNKAKAAKSTETDPNKKVEQFEKRLYYYKLRWTQGVISARVEHLTESDLMRWLLAIAATSGMQAESRFTTMAQIAPNVGLPTFESKGGYVVPSRRWEWILALDDEPLFPLLRELVREWCSQNVEAYHSDADETAIESIGSILGVDVESDWRVDEEFLDMHTIEQLDGLMSDWGIVAGGTKANRITAIMGAAATKRLAVPKSLAKVKPAQTR